MANIMEIIATGIFNVNMLLNNFNKKVTRQNSDS